MDTFEVGLNVFCIMIWLQAYWGQVVECSSLNLINLHELRGSGTIRRCDLVEFGVALLEEMCLCGTGFDIFYARAVPSSVHFLLPEDQDIELSAPSLAHVSFQATMSCHCDDRLIL